MTFNFTGLLIFLLAIIPGFLAQQSRHSIVPRSIKAKTSLEETGEYVINSLIVHLFFLAGFRFYLSRHNPRVLAALVQALSQNQIGVWLLDNRYLVLVYLIGTLVGGLVLGFIRAVLTLNQPIREWLAGTQWFSAVLSKLNVHSFLLEDPVWYGVFHQRAKGEVTFVKVKLKGDNGRFAGELHSYGIVDDSDREKDFYLIKAWFQKGDEGYRKLATDGVMLNFSDVDWIEVKKVVNPPRVSDVTSHQSIRAQP
jgi:hypothetical protein